MKFQNRKARRDYVCDICHGFIGRNEWHTVLLINNPHTKKETLVFERYHTDCADVRKEKITTRN